VPVLTNAAPAPEEPKSQMQIDMEQAEQTGGNP
jgi:hypothetical protein